MRIIIIIFIMIVTTAIIGEALSVKCGNGIEVSVSTSLGVEVFQASCTSGYLAVGALVHNQTSCLKTAIINMSNTIITIPVHSESTGDGCEYVVDTKGVSPVKLAPGLTYTISLGSGARLTVKAYEPEPAGTTTYQGTGNGSAPIGSLLPYTSNNPHTGAYTRGKEAGHKILKALLIISLLASTALAAVKEYG